MKSVLALASFIVAGCATSGANLDSARNSWQGVQYDEVVLGWGAPARSTRLSDGREAHTWVSEALQSRGSVYPSIGIFGGSGGSGIGGGVTLGSGGDAETIRCERTLVFSAGRVVEQRWVGPADYCSRFRHG